MYVKKTNFKKSPVAQDVMMIKDKKNIHDIRKKSDMIFFGLVWFKPTSELRVGR